MKKYEVLKTIQLFAVCAILIAPSLAHAHQPRITESRLTQVPDPEISKAYYAELKGEPDLYTIKSSEPFDLYVSILVPAIKNVGKDVSAEIRKDQEVLAVIGGEKADWKTFFEPFGQSTYWDGGDYKARAEAGSYSVIVTSPNNDRKYSLAIGEIEAFDGKEGRNALSLIPDLKKDFFEESPISFIKSPFGWGLILAMYILAFTAGLLYRLILRRYATSPNRIAKNNINKSGRLIRLGIAIALLLWAITTTWSPLIIFFSGFALFEAIFSWCGLNAAIGRNSCRL